jgi:ATP-binding cassette subfamily B protein
MALLLLGGTAPVLLSITGAALIGAIPGAINDGLSSPAGNRLLMVFAIAAFVFVFQYAISPFTSIASDALARRLDGLMRERVMRSLIRPAGLAHLEDPAILDQVAVARGVGPGGGFTPGGAVAPLVHRASTYIQGLLFALILTRFRWWLGIALLGSWILARRKGIRNFREVAKIYTGHSQDLRRTGYYSDLALRPPAAKEMRIFGLDSWVLSRYSAHWLEVMRKVWKQRRRLFAEFLWPSLLVWFTLLLGVWLVVMEGVARELTLGEVSLYLLAMAGMNMFVELRPEDLSIAYGFESVPVALGLDKITGRAQLRGGVRESIGRPIERIRFEDVTFHYPRSEKDVLSNLNLEIEAGKSLAIVGLNGAGKTTLIKLLCRLYDPVSGRITVDDIDLKEFPPESWQRQVRAIFQDFVRYELSARDNVGFGSILHADDLEVLKEVAELASARGLVETLPHGWDTILSRRYTGGADLSGGEWQKIALARALFAARTGPGILILDEPTANLDVRAEAEIYSRFLELTRGQTTIVISHRFSTVRRASRICVLEEGRIIEEGSHDELMARRGRYSEMFRLQASHFSEDTESASDMHVS